MIFVFILLIQQNSAYPRKCVRTRPSQSQTPSPTYNESTLSNDASIQSFASFENSTDYSTSFNWDTDHKDWDQKLRISLSIPQKDYEVGLPYNPPITLVPPPEPAQCRTMSGRSRDCCYIQALWTYFGGKHDKIDDCGCGMKIPGIYCRKGQDFIRRINWKSQKILGVIPPWISELKELTEFDVSHSEIWGEIPTSITSMTRMEKLWLYHTKMRGPIPVNIGNMQALRVFAIHDCRQEAPGSGYTGRIPESISNLKNLYQLDLYNNHLTGEIPSGVLNLPLTRIDIHRNYLSGPVPGGSSMSSYYPEIQFLRVVNNYGAKEGNKFSGPIPAFYDDGTFK